MSKLKQIATTVGFTDCTYCGLGPTSEGHDGCLGELKPKVMNACCGHGNPSSAYIQFDNCDYKNDPNKNHISGIEAYELQSILKNYFRSCAS